jgi:hypothetical protein
MPTSIGSDNGSEQIAELVAAHRPKVQKLFFPGKTMSPSERVLEAEQVLAEAQDLLMEGQAFPELDELLTTLRAASANAENRMELFKRVHRME